ncbi:MAG: YbhB/YbcL family Raf kinase inhibitor-like protein [Erythrobacter sp.]|nr:YbhB/YbcL family Raf kinase inhibitor-like protein [Erythrobacter sp.]
MSASVPDWISKAFGGAAVKRAPVLAELATEREFGRGGFALSSAAFSDGGELDPSFTAIEEFAVAPPLEWTAPPPGSQELVLVVEDLDAPGDKPVLHWLVWGLAPQKGALLEGEAPPRAGKNGQGNSEWLLPDPPLGEEHRYAFQLFAVDLPLTLMPGAEYEDVAKNLRGHVLAAAMVTARFEGHEVEEWDADEWGDDADD